MSPRSPVWVACGPPGTRKAPEEIKEKPLPMGGPGAGLVGEPDPAMAQALAAQLPARAWQDSWRARHGGPAAEVAAQVIADSVRPEPVQVRAEARGVAALNEAIPTLRRKPFPPALAPGQRDAALSKARALNSERKEIRDQLQQGRLSVAQVLAQDEEAARGMRVVTVVRALPGIGAATAARLMREAGIDAGRRAGALTAGQRQRLLAAVAAVDAELAARRDRRHDPDG